MKDGRRGRALRRWGLASAIVSAAMCGVGVAPPPVLAECDGPPISFAQYAPQAPFVLIGDVISTNPAAETDELGHADWFTLHVLYQLRGQVLDPMTIRDEKAGPCTVDVMVRTGDRIALAMGVTDWLIPGSNWSAVAFIRGTPPWPEWMETTTVPAVFQLMGLAAPDTATAPAARTPTGPWIVLLLAGLAGWLAASRRLWRG